MTVATADVQCSRIKRFNYHHEWQRGMLQPLPFLKEKHVRGMENYSPINKDCLEIFSIQSHCYEISRILSQSKY